MVLDIRLDSDKFDWFDNPYVVPNVYHIDNKFTPKLHDKIRLKKCSHSDLLAFMSETMSTWFKNSLCFEDKS